MGPYAAITAHVELLTREHNVTVRSGAGLGRLKVCPPIPIKYLTCYAYIVRARIAKTVSKSCVADGAEFESRNVSPAFRIDFQPHSLEKCAVRRPRVKVSRLQTENVKSYETTKYRKQQTNPEISAIRSEIVEIDRDFTREREPIPNTMRENFRENIRSDFASFDFFVFGP